jgi:hypothetical protein
MKNGNEDLKKHYEKYMQIVNLNPWLDINSE